MFHHAYDGYLKYAYPYDELRPLSCDGHDTWGRYEGFIDDIMIFYSDILDTFGSFCSIIFVYMRLSTCICYNYGNDTELLILSGEI